MNLGDISLLSLPRKTAKEALMLGDLIKSIPEFIVLTAVVGSLYKMTFLEGNNERSRGLADDAIVVVISYLLLRAGLSRRWGWL